MEDRHKKILQRNRTNLVRDLDPSSLYDGLLENGVFTQDMIDEIKVGGQTCWSHAIQVRVVGRLRTLSDSEMYRLTELRDQTRPGQTTSPRLRNPRESSLPFIPAVPSGDGSAEPGGAAAQWSSKRPPTARDPQ